MSSKKKTKTATATKAAPAKPAAPAKKNNKTTIITIAAIALVVVGLIVASQGGGGNGTPGALTPTPEEAKYIGRFLPAGYEEPKLGEGGVVTADTQMVPITATQSDTTLSIPTSELTTKRVVGFTYQKSDGSAPIAMIAYTKPSGKVVVAVSYCVPCKGTSHTLTTDGALTCDSCGTKRDLETGVGISGACKLYPLDEMPVTIEGDQIVIENSVLETWTEQPADRQVG